MEWGTTFGVAVVTFLLGGAIGWGVGARSAAWAPFIELWSATKNWVKQGSALEVARSRIAILMGIVGILAGLGAPALMLFHLVNADAVAVEAGTTGGVVTMPPWVPEEQRLNYVIFVMAARGSVLLSVEIFAGALLNAALGLMRPLSHELDVLDKEGAIEEKRQTWNAALIEDIAARVMKKVWPKWKEAAE